MQFEAEAAPGFGAIDAQSLQTVRFVFEDHEPLVEETALDDPLNPRVLHVELSAGFDGPGRFDVRWSTRDFYSYHYSESGLDARFDRHTNPHSPLEHFHPPPDAARDGAASCIEVDRRELVTLAVLQCWRAAHERNDPSLLNGQRDPP